MSNFTAIQHPVIKPFGDDYALGAAGGGSDTATSDWIDVSAWADKRISWEIDGANTDVDIILHTSSQGWYELDNKTATTDDYVAISVAAAHGDELYTTKDSDDIDDLQRSHRSWRVYIENDSATPCTITVWVEGSA